MGPPKGTWRRTLTRLGAFFVAIAASTLPAVALQENKTDPAPCPGPETLATPEAAEAPFASFTWPAPLAQERAPILPQTLGFESWSEFRARLVADVERRSHWNLAADLADALLRGPELLVDETLIGIGALAGRAPVRTSEEEDRRSVTERLLEIEFQQRDQRILTVFLQQWTLSEKAYLGGFEDSRVNTFGFQNRTEDADLDQLALDQRKVLWTALRRTYLARYTVRSEEHIHHEAWYLDRWSGIDFAVLPPFLGAYLYYRGLDKRVRLGDHALRIDFEPVSRLRNRNRDLPAAAALEWTVKGVPVGVIVSTGIYNGRFELDFVGLGTGIGSARGAVQGEHDARRR